MTTTIESVAELQNESNGFHTYVEKDWLLKIQDKKLSDLYGEIQSIISEYGSILSKKDEMIEKLMSRQEMDNYDNEDYVYGYELLTNLETPQKDTTTIPKQMNEVIDDHIKDLKIGLQENLQLNQHPGISDENRIEFENKITKFETLEMNFIEDRKAQVLDKLNSIINDNDSPNANNERHEANEIKNNILVDFQVLDQKQIKSKSQSKNYYIQVLYNRVVDNTEKNQRIKNLLLNLQDRFKANEMKSIILQSARTNCEISCLTKFSKNFGLNHNMGDITQVLKHYEDSIKERVQFIDNIFQIYEENYAIKLPPWTTQERVEIPSTGLYRQHGLNSTKIFCKKIHNKVHPGNSKTDRSAAQNQSKNAGAGDMLDQNDVDMDQGENQEGKEKARKYTPHDTLVWVLTLIRESMAQQLVTETKRAFKDYILGSWTTPLDEVFTSNPLIQGRFKTHQEE